MKKRIQFALIIAALFSLAVITTNCHIERDDNSYLKKVLHNLSQIESATYSSTVSGSIPGDTLKCVTYSHQTEEYINPSDTTIGSILTVVQQDAQQKVSWVYDGKAMIFMDWNEKTISIDSFKTTRTPFRPVMPPFYNYIKSIIRYALNTKDSITVELIDLTDTILFQLTVYGKSVEFIGKPHYNDPRYTEPLSKYDIWINKSDNLPYRYKRNLVSTISWESIEKVVFNKSKIEEFKVANYIPDGFTLLTKKNQSEAKIDLTNEKAPDWNLFDSENKLISLKNFNSKVILIQFTGIGCGFCHLSVPFLKNLVNEYAAVDLCLVAVETWSNDPEVIKRYISNNKLNYKYLLSTDENKKQYQISAVPVFFILDNDRIIRKIIKGYSKDSTDKEIKDEINALL
jgi:thiol-disulfide isomerase/thioredoxin